MGDVVVTNEPLIVLLKNTISDAIAEAVDDSIEARFGGVSLPTAIKYAEEVITDFCNFVAVKTNNGNVLLFVEVNCGVA